MTYINLTFIYLFIYFILFFYNLNSFMLFCDFTRELGYVRFSEKWFIFGFIIIKNAKEN